MKNPVAYFKKVAQEKREYRAAMERVRALPEDYRFVYDKIQHYMWGHVAGDGMDMTMILADLVDLFEQGEQTAAARKAILEEQRGLVEKRIADMQAGLDRLNAKIENYEGILAAERAIRGDARAPSPATGHPVVGKF